MNKKELEKYLEGNKYFLTTTEKGISLNVKRFPINLVNIETIDKVYNILKTESLLNEKITETYSEEDFIRHTNYGMIFFVDVHSIGYRTYSKKILHNLDVYSIYTDYDTLMYSINNKIENDLVTFGFQTYTNDTASVNIKDSNMSMEEIDKAKELLIGDRAKAYGDVVDNFENIKDISNILLKRKGIKLDVEDIAIVLVALKIAREGNNHKIDNIVDGIAYLQILEIMNKQTK